MTYWQLFWAILCELESGVKWQSWETCDEQIRQFWAQDPNLIALSIIILLFTIYYYVLLNLFHYLTLPIPSHSKCLSPLFFMCFIFIRLFSRILASLIYSKLIILSRFSCLKSMKLLKCRKFWFILYNIIYYG